MIDERDTTSDENDVPLGNDELRAMIEIGWQQSEQGEGRDGETVFSEMRCRLFEKWFNRRAD